MLFHIQSRPSAIVAFRLPWQRWQWGGRQVLAGSNLGDKQIQERHAISECEGSGLAAHW